MILSAQKVAMLHEKMWIAILFLTGQVCILRTKWQKKYIYICNCHIPECHFVLHSRWTEMLPSNCAVWKGLHFVVVWIALIVSIVKVQAISEWHKERAFFFSFWDTLEIKDMYRYAVWQGFHSETTDGSKC